MLKPFFGKKAEKSWNHGKVGLEGILKIFQIQPLATGRDKNHTLVPLFFPFAIPRITPQ